MSKTLVATFRSMSEAQNVKRQLLNQGYTDGDIRIVSNEGEGAATTGYASGSSTHETGVMGSIKHFFSSLTDADENDRDYYSQGLTTGGAILSVTVPDDRVESTRSLLDQYGDSEFDRGASAETACARTRRASAGTGREGDVSIPVVEEEVQIGKREVSRGGVRVYSHVTERPIEENVQLREEHVRVQRNPVNRPASEADFQAFKEGTVEVTESAEEAVVSKQARVVEEVVVGKDVSERTQTVRDSVRKTDVEVEEITPDQVRNTKTTGR
jgi:uncharacterized protein (TIGR02271 family)